MDIIAHTGLAHFVVLHWKYPHLDGAVSYRGYLKRLADAIQQVYEMNGSLFFALYECAGENCDDGNGIPHPFSRKDWEEFYHHEIEKE